MICEHCMCEDLVIDTDLFTSDPEQPITLEANDINFDFDTALPFQLGRTVPYRILTDARIGVVTYGTWE